VVEGSCRDRQTSYWEYAGNRVTATALAAGDAEAAGLRMRGDRPPSAARPRRTSETWATVGCLLVPLLIMSGMWNWPADGCVAALGILFSNANNLAVGPNAQCKFSLGITEESLKVLPSDDLRAAMAHELGHV
jgi:hypothetical protein